MISKDTLLLLGSLAYLCEGTKSKRQNRGDPDQIELVSCNPFIIRLFLRFLREIVGIEETKLRGRLEIHTNTDEEAAKVYWSGVSGISIENFQKSIIKENKTVGRRSLNNLRYGTFVVRYASKSKYRTLMGIIDNLSTIPI